MIISLRHLFSGNYQFNRTISSPQISMVGQACFNPVSESTMLYTEEGSYPLGEIEQPFYQSQSFVLFEDKLRIVKSNGDLLHEFGLAKDANLPTQLSHTHLCKDDHYQVILCLESLDAFSIHYNVNGPHKNYTIETEFHRVSDGE